LFTVLSELYNNALDHGLLKLDSSLKESDFSTYLHERESRLEALGEGLVTLSVKCAYRGGCANLEILVGDSGAGFDPALLPPSREDAPYGRGLRLVRGLCDSLEFNSTGNRAMVTHAWEIECGGGG
jgi:anti-sigma regulatory factor (Ser/Thr protein kinase)